MPPGSAAGGPASAAVRGRCRPKPSSGRTCPQAVPAAPTSRRSRRSSSAWAWRTARTTDGTTIATASAKVSSTSSIAPLMNHVAVPAPRFGPASLIPQPSRWLGAHRRQGRRVVRPTRPRSRAAGAGHRSPPGRRVAARPRRTRCRSSGPAPERAPHCRCATGRQRTLARPSTAEASRRAAGRRHRPAVMVEPSSRPRSRRPAGPASEPTSHVLHDATGPDHDATRPGGVGGKPARKARTPGIGRQFRVCGTGSGWRSPTPITSRCTLLLGLNILGGVARRATGADSPPAPSITPRAAEPDAPRQTSRWPAGAPPATFPRS